MVFGSRNERGLTKWRMPSASQTIVIVLIFALPPIVSALFLESLPAFLRVMLAVIWFIVAFIVYLYILSHGRGKEKVQLQLPPHLQANLQSIITGFRFLHSTRWCLQLGR